MMNESNHDSLREDPDPGALYKDEVAQHQPPRQQLCPRSTQEMLNSKATPNICESDTA